MLLVLLVTAHDGKAKERAADYHKINQGLNLPKKVLGFSKSSAANLNSEGGKHQNMIAQSHMWSNTCNVCILKLRTSPNQKSVKFSCTRIAFSSREIFLSYSNLGDLSYNLFLFII